MNRESFELALERVLRDEHSHNKGIGALREKTLHAVLKQYFEPFEGSHEIKLGPYVADIVGENGIVEIQTGGFINFAKSFLFFLRLHLLQWFIT